MVNRQIVIVGGGASGTLVAAQLLRQGRDRPTTVVLVEPSPTVGRGLAYGTTDALHRLNVPAGRLSAFPDDPGHFVRWVQASDPAAGEWSYLPRRTYGRYLQDVLADAVEGAGATRLHLVQGTAELVRPVETRPGLGLLMLTNGRCLPYDRLVLATGHSRPTPLSTDHDAAASGRVIDDPWGQGALAHVARSATARGGPVVLVGTGLTMVDVALSLSRLVPGTPLTAVSRHGLAPQSHPHVRRERRSLPLRFDEPQTARSLLRTVREAVDKSIAEGEDWTSVVDDLRPRTAALWQALDPVERRRFLRHVSRRWEVVRHRMAPEVGDEVARLEISGALALRAGRVRLVRAAAEELEVVVSHAGHDRVLPAVAVVNCTGPCGDVRRARAPFLHRLAAAGLVVPDPLGMGLEVDDRGAVVGPDGTPSAHLFTIGPLRRGHLLESTAIPEIRDQAARLAHVLLADGEGRDAAP